jgi:hypothetical protein
VCPEQTKRRGRTRKTESFAEWMMRLDTEVSAMVRKVEKAPPLFAELHPAQQWIVTRLVEHLLSLPRLQPSEDPFRKPEYWPMNSMLTKLYELQFPHWKRRSQVEPLNVADLPKDSGNDFKWALRHCAGSTSAAEEE